MRRTTKAGGMATAAAAALLAAGCFSVKTQHHVDPIHITLDVNLKVERELDQFFRDIDEPAGAKPAPADDGSEVTP